MSTMRNFAEETDDSDIFDENGCLRDGKRWRVPVYLCDSMQREVARHYARTARRPLIVDALGNSDSSSLMRPGWRRLVDSGEAKAARDACDQAQADYLRDLTQAWKNPPTGLGSRGVGPLESASEASKRNPPDWQRTGQGSAGTNWGKQKEGDVCAINGEPGHLRLVRGELQCVPDPPPRRQKLDGYNYYPRGQSGDDLNDRVDEIRQALLARDHDPDDVENYLQNMAQNEDDHDVLNVAVGTRVREFEMAHRIGEPRARSEDAARSIAAAMRDHAARMEELYQAHARELTEAWRQL